MYFFFFGGNFFQKADSFGKKFKGCKTTYFLNNSKECISNGGIQTSKVNILLASCKILFYFIFSGPYSQGIETWSWRIFFLSLQSRENQKNLESAMISQVKIFYHLKYMMHLDMKGQQEKQLFNSYLF